MPLGCQADVACRCDWLLIFLMTYHFYVRKDSTDPKVLAVRAPECLCALDVQCARAQTVSGPCARGNLVLIRHCAWSVVSSQLL